MDINTRWRYYKVGQLSIYYHYIGGSLQSLSTIIFYGVHPFTFINPFTVSATLQLRYLSHVNAGDKRRGKREDFQISDLTYMSIASDKAAKKTKV
ncbi:hypothetical protein TSUD_86760 [Trifolium subterraneum]|uniref:Uncharacterized protein n=1 Tax=Trifolium subterraneum TaxID=3900 RepID=A0A2Z6P8F5_TRISU|nr:hypothetical protein TSUD_86760 [Trifolium subterraneum]